VALVTDLVLPLYLTGLSSGIVIDLGYESTRILATFAGVPILSAYGATACAGHLINARLRKRLKQELLAAGQATDWLDDDYMIEDLKTRTCYVACNFPCGGSSWTMQTGQQATFPLQHRETIRISGETRWRPIEVLFEGPEDDDPDEDLYETMAPNRDSDWSRRNLSVPDLFSEVLRKCPIDVRAALLQNVLVCGGCAMLRGLLPRLAVELRTKLQRDSETTKIAERLRFTPLDFAPVCAVWTGGAVFGALEGNSDYTAEDFAEGTAIPDWARDGFV
jgi:actin-related protein